MKDYHKILNFAENHVRDIYDIDGDTRRFYLAKIGTLRAKLNELYFQGALK